MNSLQAGDSDWSERGIDVQTLNHEHTLVKLSKMNRFWKKCGICKKRNIWPWTSVYKCDKCSAFCHKKCAKKVSQVCPAVVTTVDNVTGSTFKSSNTETQSISPTEDWRCSISTMAEELLLSVDLTSSDDIELKTLYGTHDDGFNDRTTTTSRKGSATIVLTGQKDSSVVVSPGRQDTGDNGPPCQKDSGGVVSSGQQDSATAIHSCPGDYDTLVQVSPGNSGVENSPSQQDSGVVHSSGPSDSGAVGTDCDVGSLSETRDEVPSVQMKYKKYAKSLPPCPGQFDPDELYENVFNKIRRRRTVSLSIVMQNGHFVRRYTNVHPSSHAKVKVTPLPTVSFPSENPLTQIDNVENSESLVRSLEEADKSNKVS